MHSQNREDCAPSTRRGFVASLGGKGSGSFPEPALDTFLESKIRARSRKAWALSKHPFKKPGMKSTWSTCRKLAPRSNVVFLVAFMLMEGISKSYCSFLSLLHWITSDVGKHNCCFESVVFDQFGLVSILMRRPVIFKEINRFRAESNWSQINGQLSGRKKTRRRQLFCCRHHFCCELTIS